MFSPLHAWVFFMEQELIMASVAHKPALLLTRLFHSSSNGLSANFLI